MTRKFSWNNRDGLAVGYSTRRPFVTPAIPLNSNFSSIIESYRDNKANNARVNPTIPSASIAFGATPAANTVGYVTAGISRTGYTESRVIPTGTVVNGFPNNNNSYVSLPFRLYGAFVFVASGNGAQSIAAYSIAGTKQQSGTARLIFVTDEPKPIISCIGSGTNYTINVDDGSGFKRLHDSSIVIDSGKKSVLASATGGFQDLQLDFSQVGGRMRRTIEFLMPLDTSILSVWITATSTYYEPPSSPKVLHITDSLGNTAPDVTMADCYPAVLQDLIGVKDWCLMAEGGSGFIATNNNTVRTHLDKLKYLSTVSQYDDPSFLLIQASVNDASFSYGQRLQAMKECLVYALNQWPGIPVVAMGPTAANTTLSQTQSLDTDKALTQACQEIASPYLVNIQTMQGNLGLGIKGTGSILAPNGTGNADFFFKGDATHFAGAGHQLWAERLAPEIVGSLSILAGKEK